MNPQDELDWCETNITQFSYDIHNAILYYQWGVALNNSDVKREGVFRVADAFMRMTTLTW